MLQKHVSIYIPRTQPVQIRLGWLIWNSIAGIWFAMPSPFSDSLIWQSWGNCAVLVGFIHIKLRLSARGCWMHCIARRATFIIQCAAVISGSAAAKAVLWGVSPHLARHGRHLNTNEWLRLTLKALTLSLDCFIFHSAVHDDRCCALFISRCIKIHGRGYKNILRPYRQTRVTEAQKGWKGRIFINFSVAPVLSAYCMINSETRLKSYSTVGKKRSTSSSSSSYWSNNW